MPEQTQPILGFAVPAMMRNPSHNDNDSVTLKFISTKELSDEEFGKLRKWKNQEGYLLFKKNEVTAADIPKGNTDGKGLSMSQQIRRRLYVYWQELGKPGAPGMADEQKFEAFYQNEGQKILDEISKKIDKINQPIY